MHSPYYRARQPEIIPELVEEERATWIGDTDAELIEASAYFAMSPLFEIASSDRDVSSLEALRREVERRGLREAVADEIERMRSL